MKSSYILILLLIFSCSKKEEFDEIVIDDNFNESYENSIVEEFNSDYDYLNDASNDIAYDNTLSKLSEPTSSSSSKSQLRWLAYEYLNDQKKLRIHLKTRGDLNYQLYQEINRSSQPELVVRLTNTEIWYPLKRALVAEDFFSPVGYVRTRFENSSFVDIVLTLRRSTKPKMIVESSNMLIEYELDAFESDQKISHVNTAELLSANIIPQDIIGRAPQLPTSQFIPEGNPEFVDYSSLPFTPAIEDLSINSNNSNSMIPVQEGLDQEGLMNPVEISNFVEESQSIQSSNANVESKVVDNISNNKSNSNNLFEDIEFNNSNDPSSNKIVPIEVPKSAVNNFNNHSNTIIDDKTFNYDDEFDLDFEDSLNDFEHDRDNLEYDEELFEVGLPINFGIWTVAQYDFNANNMMESVNSASNYSNQNQSNTELSGGDYMDATSPEYSALTMDLEFRGSPLMEVIRALSEVNGINFIYPPNIGTQPIFVSFKNVAWDLALRAVLESNGLGMIELAPNLVRIDTIGRLATETEQIDRAKRSAERLIPTKVLVLRLSYAQASTVVNTVRNMLQSLGASSGVGADPRIRVEVDQRTNSLIVEAIPKQLEKIKILVDRLDLQTPQVEISSRIVEVQSNLEDEFGIRWSGTFNTDPSNGLGFGGLTFPNYQRSNFTIDPGVDPSGIMGVLGVKLGSINANVNIDTILVFEEKRNRTKILQTNRIVVQDNASGTLTGGQTDYFVSRGGIGGAGEAASSASSQSINYDFTINVTPRISADGAVQMDLNVSSEVPGISTSGSDVRTSRRNIQTTLLKQSGETAVIGGLWDSKEENFQSGIPILTWLPIIGPLFRRKANVTKQQELLILITPKVLNATAAGGADRFKLVDFNDFNSDSTSNPSTATEASRFEMNSNNNVNLEPVSNNYNSNSNNNYINNSNNMNYNNSNNSNINYAEEININNANNISDEDLNMLENFNYE